MLRAVGSDSGTGMRKVHTRRYSKQVPGHHMQMDVKFQAFKGKQRRKSSAARHKLVMDEVSRLNRNWRSLVK